MTVARKGRGWSLVAGGSFHNDFANQFFKRFTSRQATIDETDAGFDLLTKEDYSHRGGGRRSRRIEGSSQPARQIKSRHRGSRRKEAQKSGGPSADPGDCSNNPRACCVNVRPCFRKARRCSGDVRPCSRNPRPGPAHARRPAADVRPRFGNASPFPAVPARVSRIHAQEISFPA